MRATNAQPESESRPIPDKLYFRIGEVSRVSGVKPHVLRYWESEFSRISPRKTSSGQRLYRRKDVELILEIKHLLYEERFTIEGARKYLGQRSKKSPDAKVRPAQQVELFVNEPAVLGEIRKELNEILEILR